MLHVAENSEQVIAKEVVLTSRDVREARRLLALLSGDISDGRQISIGQLLTKATPDMTAEDRGEILQTLAQSVFVHRKRRHRFFPRAMFGEPAWDMLLSLFITDVSGARQTVGRLTDVTETPPTSALRWIQYLEKERLVEREPHPTDRRILFIELTDKGRRSVEAWLLSLLTSD